MYKNPNVATFGFNSPFSSLYTYCKYHEHYCTSPKEALFIHSATFLVRRWWSKSRTSTDPYLTHTYDGGFGHHPHQQPFTQRLQLYSSSPGCFPFICFIRQQNYSSQILQCWWFKKLLFQYHYQSCPLAEIHVTYASFFLYIYFFYISCT